MQQISLAHQDHHHAEPAPPIAKAMEEAVLPELTSEMFHLIAQGHVAFQLLNTGIQLGLFEILAAEPGARTDRIAELLNLRPQPTRILLTGLTAIKVIEQREGGFANAAVTADMLLGGHGEFARVIGWQREIVYPGLVDLTRSLQEDKNIGLRHFPGSGNTLYERIATDESLEKVFQDSMSGLSDSSNRHLQSLPELSEISHLVDAGGGDGTNILSLTRAWPHLKATVFDSPTVCARADANIENAGMTSRCHTHRGNFFEDAFPEGTDAVLFSHILTIWSLERNLKLLRRTCEALPSGGRVIVFGMMGRDDDTGPVSTALGSAYFQTIATGEGMLYSRADFEGLIRAAGFKRVRSVTDLPIDHCILVGQKE